jgi:hypothetical protein
MTTSAFNYSNTASYTLVPHTTTFDASSALESVFVCTLSESYWAEYDFTLTACIDYTVKPTAAITSLAYRSGYSPFPSGNVIPTADAGLYDVYYQDMMPSATTTVTLAQNITQIETSATPFVYFTAYEVEYGNKTETVTLRSAQAYPYWVKGVEDASTATGQLPEGFLEQISQSACDAGKLQAVVTVIIVVDLYYQNWPMLDPFLVHFESTALGFDDPPVIVNDFPSGTKAIPITVADWDISGTKTKPTTTSVSPNNRPDRVPTTAHVGDAPFLIISQPSGITVGTVGTDPVVIGPSSEVVVGSQTLQPGGSPINVGGGIPVSLVPSATAIVVGGTTSSLPQVSVPAAQPQVRPPPVLTIGSLTITPNAATQFFIAPGQTLTLGGVVTVDGTVVSLAPSASFVVIGGSTQALRTTVGSPPAVNNPPRLVFGGSTITAQSAQAGPGNRNNQDNLRPGPTFVVSGQTLAPGAPAIIVSGTTLSLAPSGSGLVVNGVTSTLANPVAQAITPPTLTVGNEVFSPLPSLRDPIVIAGQTLTPGGPAITVSGTTLSLAPSASFVVMNGATSTISIPATPTITVGDSVFSPTRVSPGPTFVIGDQTLAPGRPAITISGTTLSLASSAAFVVVNGVTSTIANPSASSSTTPPTITIGNDVISALPESSGPSFILGLQTLLPGGPAITVSGTTLSLAPSASFVVINGVTSTLTNPAAAQITAPPLTIGDVTFRPLPGTGTAYLIGSILLTPGGSIVTASTTISLASGATALVINGQTSFISSGAEPIITNPPLLTIGSQTYTAISGGGTTFVIDDQTLVPGGSIVIDGTTISLTSGATQLVYGSVGKSTTSVLFPGTATPTGSGIVTGTKSATAGAKVSDFNGQAASTSSREGRASQLSGQKLAPFAFIVLMFA